MLEAPRSWFEAPLVLILVTALWTALIAEPLKIDVSNRLKKRQLRRIILMEIMWNVRWLHSGVDWLAPFGEEPFKDSARRSSSRAAYESCQRDFYLYYKLPEHEWIDGFYSDLEKITVLQQEPKNLPRCGDLAREMVNQCVEYLKQHPGTWRVVRAAAPSFLHDAVKPTRC
jgi:hypothetical protein